MKAKILIVPVLAAFLAAPVSANWAPGDAPFINTWLVLGTFDNREGVGMRADLIGEAAIRPRAGEQADGKTWRFFDDRTFSRNYDDYQDLFSYFFVRQDDPRDGRMAYLHTWVWSPRAQQVDLRVGVNHEWSARINGEVVTLPTPSDVPPGPAPGPHTSHDKALSRPGVQFRLKDAMMRRVSLRAGWNSLLLKVGNRAEGLFGFYARLSDGTGNAIPALLYSVNGPTGKLAVTTPALPTAWRSWSYAEFKVPGVEALEKRVPELSRFSYAWAQASAFQLNAEGTRAPFRWDLSKGKLPAGLSMTRGGRILGRVDPSVHLGEYPLVVRVTDATGASAEKRLMLNVKENPTRAFEQSRMTALIHGPENIPPESYSDLAMVMKRQGYRYVMPISYGNGDTLFRWPVRFYPKTPAAHVVPGLKKAFDAEGIKFGMYLGQFEHIPTTLFQYDQVILILEDAMRRYEPASFFFDWRGRPQHYPDTDAWYSMIRSYNPECLLILNGTNMPQNGDWDLLCQECRGAVWNLWPGEYLNWLYPMLADWPKTWNVDSWLTVNPTPTDARQWPDYVKEIMSLIGEGYVVDLDHTVYSSASWAKEAGKPYPPVSLDDNSTVHVHRQIADWANPDRQPSLQPAFTDVDPGPLHAAEWGYNVISTDRRNLYLHMLENPRGKTGLPSGGRLIANPLAASQVRQVVWMNANRSLKFASRDDGLSIDLTGVKKDVADTIIRIELRQPLPENAIPRLAPFKPRKDWRKQIPGNLAWQKPARLLSLDGTQALAPSSEVYFASLAVDGDPNSFAVAGGQFAWTLEIDLDHAQIVSRVRILFAKGYPTDYAIAISADGKSWTEVHRGAGTPDGKYAHTFAPTNVRYVRALSYKPNGPGQEGGQMCVAELEVYEK